MATIPESQLPLVKKLYKDKQYSMQQIAQELGVHLNAVVYCMRHHKIQRRTATETNKILYKRQPASFTKRTNLSELDERRYKTIVAMLYWAEGYDTKKTSSIDFANSDADMVHTFVSALRSLYILDGSKFRCSVYCYSNQNIDRIHSFWSGITGIPEKQFTKPYVRDDYREDGRKMKNGLVHVRYHDKKLLIEIRNLIDYYRAKLD